MDTRPRDARRAIGVRPATASLAAVLSPSSHHLLAYRFAALRSVSATPPWSGVAAAGRGRLFAENLPVFRFPVVTTPVGASLALSLATELVSGQVRRAVNI